MSATIRQALVLAPRPGALLRELVRFGVTEITLKGEVAPLPRDIRIVHLPASAEPLLQNRFLLCEAEAVLDFNLARLLAVTGPCVATRGGADAGIRVMGTGEPRRVPVTTLPQQSPRPALFLDRDGTINVDHGYVGTSDRFEWVDGALAAIRMATDAGWHVFVVTNQSGIARGYYDEPTLMELHDWMVDEIRAAGGNVDDLRYCPFHEAATVPRYRRASDWRKPAPGMILDLVSRWSLDPARCVLVGDQPTDMAAAAAAGIAGRLFQGGSLATLVSELIRDQAAGEAAINRSIGSQA